MSLHLKDEQVRSKKYKRDGAKYVCTECKSKFFSKEEVESCYDSHGKSADTASTQDERSRK